MVKSVEWLSRIFSNARRDEGAMRASQLNRNKAVEKIPASLKSLREA
jgi:hypothetical protein